MATYDLSEQVELNIAAGFPQATFVKIELPDHQGGTVRWCDAPVAEDQEFNGEMWTSDNPVLAVKDARTIQAEEGIVSIKIADPTKEWFEKLRKSPAQGLRAEIWWTFPLIVKDADNMDAIEFEAVGAFPGRIDAISTSQEEEGDIETDINLISKLYYTERGVGQYTSDSWQRSQVIGQNPDGSDIINSEDSSHVVAHRAAQFPLHKVSGD